MIKHGIELRFVADGATPEEIERGEAAAWAVFDAAEVNPWDTAAAAFKQEGEVEDMTNEEGDLAELWRSACAEAKQACCGSWDKTPWDTDLQLVRK